MGEMEIASWLKTLPLAPEYRPTEAEFADPIAYILKIEEEARMYGVCKIIPPYTKASKKTVAFHLNRSLALSRDTVSSGKMHGSCPSMSRSMGGVIPGLQFLKQKSSPLDVSGTDSSGKAKFDTRRQQVGWNPKKTRGVAHSQTHKLVWESGEKYTLEQFEQKAKLFSRQRLGTCKDVSPLAVETLFWKAAADKHISVEYANDIPGSAFAEPVDSSLPLRGRKRKRGIDDVDQVLGVGPRDESFPIDESPGVDEELDSYDVTRVATGSTEGVGESGGSAGSKLANSAWNMRNVARSPGSLLRFMPDEVPGVTSPMVYIGMLFSWFAWHVEDHELHSLNYLHTGACKTWYAVPGDAAPALEEAVRVHGYGGQLNARAAFSLLGEKTTVMSPEVLVSVGVPCCRLVQNAGEYVVTFPRAYHLGFSHGFNCGEAANFATPGWLDVAKDAAARRAAMNYLPMLSHQQLLYLLTMSLPPRVLSSCPSEPRSSRLKVRKKSPGEEMVKNIFVNDVIHNNRLLGLLLDKGVPCCLLAKDAVNHAAANIRASEYSEHRLRLRDNSLPSGDFVHQGVDSTNFDVGFRAVSLVTQMEDVNGGNQVSSVKLADSTLDIFHPKYLTAAEAEANHGLPKIVDVCAPSELPGSSSEGLESNVAPQRGDSAASTPSLAIDWGILPCAACGILCYATMAVVEPTSKALLNFKSLPFKPIHPAVGLSSHISEGVGARTESVEFVVDSRASMNQGLDLTNEMMVSSGKAEHAEGASEHVNSALIDGSGTPVAEIKQLAAFGDDFSKVHPSLGYCEGPKSYDNTSIKSIHHSEEDAHAETAVSATVRLEDEHVQTSEVSQHLKTEPDNLEASIALRTGGYRTTPQEVRDVGEQAELSLGMSRDVTVETHTVMENVPRAMGGASPSLETPSELKSSNTLSSLQLLVSTYDEDSSDVEGEDILDDKVEDCEEEETCQVHARPDSTAGHLLTDFVGLSADVSWLCVNPIVVDMKGPPLTIMNSPSYTLESLAEGPQNLQSVFTSGGFAFVEEGRLVDLATLQRLLHEKDNMESTKGATTDGCSAIPDQCEDSADVLEDEKVDDMQELYRRINSEALNDDSQDDDIALINFESPLEFASWQPEPSSTIDVISASILNQEAETSISRINVKNLGASNFEPGSGENNFLTKCAGSMAPNSMISPRLNGSLHKMSYKACHAALDNGLFSRSDGKSFEGKLECRMFDGSNHRTGGQVSFFPELPCVLRKRGFHMSLANAHEFVGSNGRDLDESTPRTCSSLGRESCATDQLVGRAGSEGIGPDKAVRVSVPGSRQRARGGVGRPRVLCLEHAVEAQKRLEDIGGAHILIVCHSGFEDYEIRAKEIAQESGIEHAWRDISFSGGSEDEIERVKMAVDVEENDDHGYTDWISQLGMLVHPRFTTKESEAFDSFKKVTGAFRAGPFKKGKPGRPSGSSLMAGRLGVSMKGGDDLKTHSSGRTAVDFEGKLKGSKKKRCMVVGKWCGKVWRVHQVHPLLGGSRSFDLSAQIGAASTSLNTSNLSSEAIRAGFTKGLPLGEGPTIISSPTTGVEDQQIAKKRGRQRKMIEHSKDQISEDSSGGPPRNMELNGRKDWKLLEEVKDQGSEDSSLGSLKIHSVATSKKTSSVADSEGGQSASILPQKLQSKSRDSFDEEENVDNKKETCSPLEEVEPPNYPVHTNPDGVVQSVGQSMPIAAYDPLTTDDKNKCSKFMFDPSSSQRNSGVGESAQNERSDGVILHQGDNYVVPSATTQTFAPSQSEWQVLSELQEDAVGTQNGDPPDSPQVHSRGSLTEPPATDAVGQQPTAAEATVLIVRGSSDPGSSFCFSQNPAKDGGTRSQRPGKGPAVWCDVPIASSWTAAGSASVRSDPPVNPHNNVHPPHDGNQMYFASCSGHPGDTGCDVSNDAARPVKGKLLHKYGLEDPISVEKHQTALKMRRMLDFEGPQVKRSPAEVMSSEEPVNDVESITTSKLLGWKRKVDGGTANTSGKKAKSFDNGKSVKFQQEPDMLDRDSDKAISLNDDEVNNVQELCESSCHPQNELEQFDYEDDGSQHTLRDIKYVYGVSDCRGEFLTQAEGFVGEDTRDDHLTAEQTVEDQGSCVPVTMLDSQIHDCGSQKLQKSRVTNSSRTSPPDDSGRCAPGLHPLDVLPLITSNRGKPLGKTRGKRSKPLKQIWTILKQPQSDGSTAEKSDGKPEAKYDTQMNSSEVHNLQAVQCVEARFEAEVCDRVLELADHSLGRTSGQSTRRRGRGQLVEEPDSEDDGEEPKITPEKTKKKGRPKKKKVVGRKPKDEEDKEFQCDLDGCRMSFATDAELSIHKKNRCTFKGCNKRFFMHKYLLQHRRVHQPDRPLKCPWVGCPQTFKWAWARTEHIRVHTGERPYTCPDCEQTFRFVSDFSRHKRNTGHTKG